MSWLEKLRKEKLPGCLTNRDPVISKFQIADVRRRSPPVFSTCWEMLARALRVRYGPQIVAG